MSQNRPDSEHDPAPGADSLRSGQHALIEGAFQQFQKIKTEDGARLDETRLRTDLRQWCDLGAPRNLPGYTIDEEIHRGGQGVVYRARQMSTGRHVAIKVMLGGIFSGPRERARFDREVHILARLKHPNIVTIHDSGVSEGAAYFVMDYIAGKQLDEFVGDSRLPLHDRLTMFVRICDAVNTAHLHGVIHRDLKPGNIRIDENGAPHVLDFGLAKDPDVDESHGHSMTQTGQFLGSLPWASPEQSEGRHDLIDVRTDVYSLGVILYQTLTGKLPYELGNSISETAHRIQTVEPQSPRKLNPEIDDELETILLKALRKAPEQRYQTAGNLGRDIQRYLDGDPIEAKRESVTYIIRKQFKRHRAAFSVAVSFVLLLVAALVVSLFFWRGAELAREGEIAERRLAERNGRLAEQRAEQAAREAAKARAVSDFLSEMISSVDPIRGGKGDVTVQEVVESALAELDQGSMKDQPELEAEVRHVVGLTYGGLGQYDAGAEQVRRAVELFQSIGDEDRIWSSSVLLAEILRHGGHDADAEALLDRTLAEVRKAQGPQHVLAAQCLDAKADILRGRAENEAAIDLYRQAVEIYQAHEPPDAEAVASALNDWALALEQTGDIDGAMSIYERARSMFEKTGPKGAYQVAIVTSNLGGLYAKKGEFDRAEAHFEEALAAFRRYGGENHPMVASCLDSIGRMYITKREFARAEPFLRQALDTRRAALGEDHPLMAHSYNNLAMAETELGKLDEAAEHYRMATDVLIATRGPDHPSVASLKNNVARIHQVKGEYEEAATLLREALAITLENYGDGHPQTALAHHNVGKSLLDTGDLENAESHLKIALRMREELLGVDHPETASSADILGAVYRAMGRYEEAEALTRRAVDILREKVGPRSSAVAHALSDLGTILNDDARPEEAVEVLEEAVDIAREAHPKGHWVTGAFVANLGGALLDSGKTDEAVPLMEEGFDLLSGQLGTDHPKVRPIVERLLRAARETGDDAAIARWSALLPAEPETGTVQQEAAPE